MNLGISFADVEQQTADSKSRATPARMLLALIVCESLLAGSGRPLEIGPVTFRMILFLMALIYGYLSLFRARSAITTDVSLSLLWAASTLVIGTMLGVINGNGDDFILLDLRYYCYFLCLPFFLSAVGGPDAVRLVTMLVKRCALALALGYGGIQVLIAIGVMSARSLRVFADSTPDFTPRAAPDISAILPIEFQIFFYSGFVFLGVGIIFYFLEDKRNSMHITGFILLMLFCTLTRGFVVGLAGVALLYATLNRRPLQNMLVLSLIAALSVASLVISTDSARDFSDTFRMRTIAAVLDRMTPATLIWGHGFGGSVPTEARNIAELTKSKAFQNESRYLHLENSYVEVLDKQGLVGLSFYAVVFVLMARQFWRLRKTRYRTEAAQFFLGSTYIYFVSMFNPYVTNSIGMSFVCLSIAAMAALENAVWRTATISTLEATSTVPTH